MKRMKVIRVESTKSRARKSKADQMLSFFKDGQAGTMEQLAKQLKTTTPAIRSFINSLRKRGYQIFNRPIAGTNKTEYFIPSRKNIGEVVKNKARISMVEERGTYLL